MDVILPLAAGLRILYPLSLPSDSLNFFPGLFLSSAHSVRGRWDEELACLRMLVLLVGREGPAITWLGVDLGIT